MKKFWHMAFSGHKWEVKGHTACPPDEGLATWASGRSVFESERDKMVDLAVKARYGWTECLLVCNCGEFTKVEMVGNKK